MYTLAQVLYGINAFAAGLIGHYVLCGTWLVIMLLSWVVKFREQELATAREELNRARDELYQAKLKERYQ